VRVEEGNRPTDRQTNGWLTGMVCDYRSLSLCRQQRGLTLLSIEFGPTALASPMTMTLTYDPDLQSPASNGHDPLTCKNSRSNVSRLRRKSGNKRTFGRMDRRTEAIALPPSLMRSVKIDAQNCLEKQIARRSRLAQSKQSAEIDIQRSHHRPHESRHRNSSTA